MKLLLQNISQAGKEAFILLKQNDPLILASSTAFFTTFSISPIVIILVKVLGLYFQSGEVSHKLFTKIGTVFGDETSDQIAKIVNNMRSFDDTWWITIGGVVFLVFVATTLLKIVKQAIHLLWHIKKRVTSRLRYTLRERVMALSMIFIMGLLFIVSLLLDASAALLHRYLHEFIPSVDPTAVRIVNNIFSILVVTVWFTTLFKIIPDANVCWSVAFTGGFLTSILFNTGEFILGKLLVYSNIEGIFGASTSVVLVLLFIFYSSLILYYGAAFTYTYGQVIGKPIEHGKFSDKYEVKIISNQDQG